jgi:hypothetical protein
MREMTAHMTDALTRVRELSTERVGQRLAHTLLRLMHQGGRPAPDGVLIPHLLTRQELAELTGTTLYTVSRLLSKWQADGVLRSSGRRLIATVCSSAKFAAALSRTVLSIGPQAPSPSEHASTESRTAPAESQAARTCLLGMRQVLPGRRSRVRQRHYSHTAPGRALR